MILTVQNLTKAFGINEVLKGVSLQIENGEHVGLVGVNGSGKSTLLHCLLDFTWADGGSVKFAPQTSIGFVQQGFEGVNGSIWDYITSVTPKVLQYKDDLDDYTYDARIKRVLIGLGYTEEWWQRDAATLSGGQKTRLLLACALVRNPDFLILDEPTNHLDIYMTEWLEQYLREFKGSVLVVSHDRAFLDNVVTRTLEAEAGLVKSYKGNYSRYLEQKAIEVQSQTAAYNAQQAYIAKTEAYIRRFKAGIKSKQARGRQSQLNRLERIEAPVENEEFNLRLPAATECANRVVVMDKLTIGYENNVLAKDIKLELLKGQKVALIGANGTGKSTLLKTLLGELQPLSGSVKIGNRVKIGYFSQSYERLKNEETLLDNFLREYGFTIEQTRSLLGGMLFHGDEVFKKIGDLSGGQKARLVLLKLVLDGANFLVLDEPTNHLDILARETVEAALCAFDGTVLLVTHDRYFVKEIAERIWEIAGGELHDYKGDYEFYLKQRVVRVQDSGARIEDSGKTPQSATEKLTLTAPLTGGQQGNKTEKHIDLKAVEKVEQQIREYEAMLKYTVGKMENPDLGQCEMEMLTQEYNEYEKIVNELMEKWEALQS